MPGTRRPSWPINHVHVPRHRQKVRYAMAINAKFRQNSIDSVHKKNVFRYTDTNVCGLNSVMHKWHVTYSELGI